MDKSFKSTPVRRRPRAGYDCSQPGTSCFYNEQDVCVNCGRPKGWKRGHMIKSTEAYPNVWTVTDDDRRLLGIFEEGDTAIKSIRQSWHNVEFTCAVDWGIPTRCIIIILVAKDTDGHKKGDTHRYVVEKHPLYRVVTHL